MEKELVVDLKSVSVQRDDKKVLDQLDLKLHLGEFYYLVGRSGSGKSTLLKCIYADNRLTSGEGTVLETNLRKLNYSRISKLRRSMGIVFQDYQLLYDRNVKRNLSYVLKATGWKKKSEINNRIEEVLELVGMSKAEKEMPYNLSGGEQQRISIARAILNKPKLFIADEPTGNLDPKTSEDIIKLMKDLNTKENTFVIATHDHVLINKFPSKTLKCEDGKIYPW